MNTSIKTVVTSLLMSGVASATITVSQPSVPHPSAQPSVSSRAGSHDVGYVVRKSSTGGQVNDVMKASETVTGANATVQRTTVAHSQITVTPNASPASSVSRGGNREIIITPNSSTTTGGTTTSATVTGKNGTVTRTTERATDITVTPNSSAAPAPSAE